jgi:hypothetical protein
LLKIETRLRDWIRSLGLPVEWTEAARGGTAGIADCRLILSEASVVSGRWLRRDIVVPIELKSWSLLQNGFWAARLRREQVRYHFRMNEAGMKTLLLWNSPDVAGTIYALPGRLAPKKVVDRIAFDLPRAYETGDAERERFRQDILNGQIWS